ncbi:MAG TPA: hypothetical protein VGH28_31625 [Polyangiaceae bacterium]
MELVAIEGEQLSAVTFVQDYVQLHFDGPTLTTITRPTVIAGDASWEYGTLGYRDRLCELIGLVVLRASVRPGDRLQIDFADGKSVSVSLRPEAYRAGEAVIFSDGDTEQWACW